MTASILMRIYRVTGIWLCSLRGHTNVKHVTRHRVCLKCIDCGLETAGWQIDAPRFSHSQSEPGLTVRVRVTSRPA
jgi:hypothetical protein